MLTHTKLLATALMAGLILSAAVAIAHARRFEFSNTAIRAAWTGGFQLNLVTSLVTIRCPVTIEGSLHSRTFGKVSGQLIGYITSAALRRPCTNGEDWIQNGTERLSNGTTAPSSLPWHIRYDSFSGTLPNISNILLRLTNVALLFRTPFESVGCLYITTMVYPMVVLARITGPGRTIGLSPDPFVTIPAAQRLEGIATCPNDARFETAADAPLTVQGTSTQITLRLVQ
jgi:hypothetical protein